MSGRGPFRDHRRTCLSLTHEGVPFLPRPKHRIQCPGGFFARGVMVDAILGVSSEARSLHVTAWTVAQEQLRSPLRWVSKSGWKADPVSFLANSAARSRPHAVDLNAERPAVPLFPLSCLGVGLVRHLACDGPCPTLVHRPSMQQQPTSSVVPCLITVVASIASHLPSLVRVPWASSSTCHEAVQSAHVRHRTTEEAQLRSTMDEARLEPRAFADAREAATHDDGATKQPSATVRDVVERDVRRTDAPKATSFGSFPEAKHRRSREGRTWTRKERGWKRTDVETEPEGGASQAMQASQDARCSRLKPEHVQMHQRIHRPIEDEGTSQASWPSMQKHAQSTGKDPTMETDKHGAEEDGPGHLRFDAHGRWRARRSERTDWDGTTGTTDPSVTGSVTRDVLRAREDPDGHTYTVVELAHLLRSSVMQQRVLSLRILAHVVETAHPSTRPERAPDGTTWADLWAYLLKDVQMVDLLRWTLDDEHAPVVTAAAKCIETLVRPRREAALLEAAHRARGNRRWTPLAPMQRDALGCPWHTAGQAGRAHEDPSEEMRTIEDQLDPLRALVRRDLLPRVRYLLQVHRPTGSRHTLLKILCAVARHSPGLCDEVLKCPYMVECLQELETSAEDPIHNAVVLELVGLLCRGSKNCAVALLEKGLLSHLLRHTMLESSRESHLHGHVYEIWAEAAAYGLFMDDHHQLYRVVQKDLAPPKEDASDGQLDACAAVFCMLEQMSRTVGGEAQESVWVDRTSLLGNLAMAAEHACLWLNPGSLERAIDPGAKPPYLFAFGSVLRFLRRVIHEDWNPSAGPVVQRVMETRKDVEQNLLAMTSTIGSGVDQLMKRAFGQVLANNFTTGEALTEGSVAAADFLHSTYSILDVVDGFEGLIGLMRETLLQIFTNRAPLHPDSGFSMIMWTPPVAAFEQMRSPQVSLLSDLVLAAKGCPCTPEQIQGGLSRALEEERNAVAQEGLLSCLLCMVRPGEETKARSFLASFFGVEALHNMIECGHSRIQQFAVSNQTATSLLLYGGVEDDQQQKHAIRPLHLIGSVSSLSSLSESLKRLYEHLFCQEQSCALDSLLLPAEGSCLPLGFSWFLEPFKRVDALFRVEKALGVELGESSLCLMLLIHLALETTSNCSLQRVPKAEKLRCLSSLFASEQDLFRMDAIRIVLAGLLDSYTMDGFVHDKQQKSGVCQESLPSSSRLEAIVPSSENAWLLATEISSLVGHYCAVSFGDKLFGRFLAYHMQCHAPASVRISVWQVLINNRSLHLLPRLSECAGSGQDYLALSADLKAEAPAQQTNQEDELMLLELYVEVFGDLSLYKLSTKEIDSPIALWIIIYQLSAFFFADDIAAQPEEIPFRPTSCARVLQSRQCLLQRAILEWDEHAWNAVLHCPTNPSFSPHEDFRHAFDSSRRMVDRGCKRNLLLQACQDRSDLQERLASLRL